MFDSNNHSQTADEPQQCIPHKKEFIKTINKP